MNNVIVNPFNALGWPCRLPFQPKVYADQFQSDENGLLEIVLIIRENWKGVGSCAVSIVFEAVNRSLAAGKEAKVIANPIKTGETVLDHEATVTNVVALKLTRYAFE